MEVVYVQNGGSLCTKVDINKPNISHFGEVETSGGSSYIFSGVMIPANPRKYVPVHNTLSSHILFQ